MAILYIYALLLSESASLRPDHLKEAEVSIDFTVATWKSEAAATHFLSQLPTVSLYRNVVCFRAIFKVKRAQLRRLAGEPSH